MKLCKIYEPRIIHLIFFVLFMSFHLVNAVFLEAKMLHSQSLQHFRFFLSLLLICGEIDGPPRCIIEMNAI